MRQLAAAVLVFASGCSLLFDPLNVPVGDGGSGVSDGGCGCGARPNATAMCSGQGCSYSCNGSFRDFDGDLEDGGTNGCELDCANATAAANPPGVVATVGNPQGIIAGGALELKWPEANPVSDAYQICIGQPPSVQCSLLPAGAVCDAGLCVLLTPGGLPVNSRLSATVRGIDFCTGPAGDPVPAVSFTPLNPLLATAFDIDTSPAGCVPTLSLPSSGELQVGNPANCLSRLKLGDVLWGDATVQVDTFVTAGGTPSQAGLGVQGTTAGHVVGAGFGYQDADRSTIIAYWPPQVAQPQFGATSVFTAAPNQWVTLRLVVNADVLSLSAAPAGQPLVERLRWPSPEADAGSIRGKPGLFVNGGGTVRFRRFLLSTTSDLPPDGPTSVNYSMADAGNTLPASWKVRPMPGSPAAGWTPCPPFPEASGCDGGSCAAGARGCLRIERTANIFVPDGTVLFDLPTGIDVRRDWSYSFRFAATDGGAQGPVITGFPSNNFFEPGDLLRAPNSNFSSPLESGPQTLPITLQTNHWNHVKFHFQPDAGTVALQFNGTQLPPYARPTGWDRHTGALQIGLGTDVELFVTDINISQP